MGAGELSTVSKMGSVPAQDVARVGVIETWTTLLMEQELTLFQQVHDSRRSDRITDT